MSNTTADIPVPTLPPAPSVHARAILTWLAIFPLVSVGMLLFAPVWGEWHPVLRALLLTAIVVPLAVYVVVPALLRGYTSARRRGIRHG
jgi:antibiotic biosynthesis monooxygenase (ABM) superfamily enzyme